MQTVPENLSQQLKEAHNIDDKALSNGLREFDRWHGVSTMERRTYHRYLVSLEIEVKESGGQFAQRGSTTDVSVGGCYVATIFPLAIGTGVTFKMWVDGRPLAGEAKVQTCHPGVGMGIMFIALGEDDKSRLEHCLRSAAPVSMATGIQPSLR